MVIKRFGWHVLALLLLATGLSGCSQNSNSIVSKSWHNLNAHYNAYFLAREKLKEVDKSVYAGHVENYNRILDVYPPVTQAMETGLNANLLEAIKKASLPIQRHKNSKWVDDCYLEIGKARYYKREDYENAIHTFKYVNGKSKDVNLRHTALIWLLRTYVKGGEANNAFLAVDYLKKQKMITPNRRDYHIARAYYHQSQREYVKMADNLEEATSYMFWHSDKRARYHYIIGQVRQRNGQDSAAYQQFRKVVKNNPPYEMAFYARLSMAQVTPAKDQKKVDRAKKSFKKMLRDPKNEEYRDRTYYEMARFEIKLGNYDQAITYYKESTKAKGKNPNQKAYSYLGLGELYYEKLRNYVMASKYYDSCVATLDTLEDRYPAIVKRQKTLKEFATQYEIVQREDSLLNLAALAKRDSAALLAKIDKMVAADEARERAAEKEAKKAARRAAMAAAGQSGVQGNFDGKTNLGFNAGGGAAGATWYFYNPTAIAAGKQAWDRRWGKRVLEDNWRRSAKERNAGGDGNPDAPADSAKKDAETAIAKGDKPKDDAAATAAAEKEKDAKKDPAEDREAKRKKYLSGIPFSEKDQLASHEKLKPALYIVGKIYDQQLDEPGNAEKVFQRLVTSYYEYEKTPEVMYFLYLLYGKQNNQEQAQVWRNRLLKEFPDSKYAKLILNPNYLKENKAVNDLVAQLYEDAYEKYEAGQFVEAQSILATIRTNYPDNRYREKMRLLDIMIIGKTNDLMVYMDSLDRFIASSPKSQLLPFAKDLRTTALAFKVKQMQSRDTTKPLAAAGPQATPYNAFVNTNQIVVIALPQDVDAVNMQQKVALFNGNYYPDETFTVDNALLGDGKHTLVRVREFRTRLAAMNYVKKMQTEPGTPMKDKEVMQANARIFIITPDNFPLLYRSKNIDEYMGFFNKHYDLSVLHGF